MKDEIVRESMAPNKSNRLMFIRSESWCINIKNLAWDFLSELEMCFGLEAESLTIITSR